MSSQCQELNALHSLSVDGGRIVIPERLKAPPMPDDPYVLDVLGDAAKRFADDFLQSRQDPIPADITPATARQTIIQLLSSDKLAVSEYELVTSALAIARRYHIDPRPYFPHIDFSALTSTEKHALNIQLGLSPEQDPYVWNRYGLRFRRNLKGIVVPSIHSLIRSDIIQPRELQGRDLGGPLRLQRLYSSQIQGRAAFFEYLREAIEDYTRKLIILKVSIPPGF